ncbi:hypothetical protein AV654_17585 [Paenibacillus elgii]|uniref:Uncharacterized protein n=2 Tax=Paenibacillus elgii TaxID=189691 RepID=A0A163YE06_9BACL|nr:hypothetical protein AV654_17585 [Paenibacillus elgii]
MAEIHFQAMKLGSYSRLPLNVHVELRRCMEANAKLILKIDQLNQLAFHAHTIGDTDWERNILNEIEEIKAKGEVEHA